MDQTENIQMHELKGQIENVDLKVENVDEKVDKILGLLKGNDLDKTDTGFIGLVNTLYEKVKNLEKFKERVIYIGIGMTLPASYGIFGLISSIIKALSK